MLAGLPQVRPTIERAMAELTLSTETRTPSGTRSARRLRAEGKIPAVVYGRGSDPTHVVIDRRELRGVLTTDAGTNALINLDIDGDSKLSLVKDLQRDPVRNVVTHVDFILVSRTETVTVEVPVVIEGESRDINNEGGLVDQSLYSLTISARPGDIPDAITVDVTALTVGGAIRVADLVLPDGVTTDVDPEEVLVSGHAGKLSTESEAPAEGEGEDSEPAGEADAAGGESAEG